MVRFAVVLLSLVLLLQPVAAQDRPLLHNQTESERQLSAAYRWVDVLLEVAAKDVERVGARPTILSRQMAIPLTAAYDAWALYDERALPTRLDPSWRRPLEERTQTNKETALA